MKKAVKGVQIQMYTCLFHDFSNYKREHKYLNKKREENYDKA